MSSQAKIAVSDKKLIRIAREFRSGLLGGKPSKNMCGAVSYALAGYLRTCGIECETVMYEVHKTSHVCLTLPDSRVLDATADQFKRPDGSDMPDVYIGKKPSWYL